MTIGEKINAMWIEGLENRYEKLTEIGAPQVILEGIKATLEEMKNGGGLKISGETEVLSEEHVSCEARKGRGGKTYFVINGYINFFPNAKYGPYIKRA